MPPKKQQLTGAKFRLLVRNHGIRFEGPAPPKEWPSQHKHHFHVIRRINAIRYDDYKADQGVPKQRKEDFKKRVMFLRKKTYGFLEDEKTNETTWRELEQSILMRFDQRVICGNCCNELWKADFEANSLHVDIQADLTAKRNRRKMCCCANRPISTRTEDIDEENCEIFNFAKDEAVTHAAGDNLQNISIPMTPDRVIGLRAPLQVTQADSYFPIMQKRILLPFLVVEAKKEKDAPGFRAIQYQTAFPIRRFLKAQNDLYQDEQSIEPCLVWFFSYQGEIWRLHGGTFENNKIRLYDLWQGTIQSQDGALQLLLIVDYIWSWARDLYRPSVRKSLSDTVESSRDYSPASIDRFRHSISISTAPSPATHSQDTDLMQIDQFIDTTKNLEGSHISTNLRSDSMQEAGAMVFEKTNSNPSIKPAVVPELAPSWTEFGSIRYANIVQFEFRCLNVGPLSDFTLDHDGHHEHSTFRILSSLAFEIHEEQLNRLATLWIPTASRIPTHSPRSTVTLFFQTYCDQRTWQIKRVLNCIIWRREPVASLQLFEMNDLEAAILETQQIHGRESVWYALRDVSLAFVPKNRIHGPKWVSFEEVEIPDGASEFLIDLEGFVDFRVGLVQEINLFHSLLQINLPFQKQHDLKVPDLRKDTRRGNSMLVVRSPEGPEACSKFCLFVLLGDVVNDKDVLCQLLDEAKQNGSFYGSHECRLSRLDWRMLDQWSRALGGTH